MRIVVLGPQASPRARVEGNQFICINALNGELCSRSVLRWTGAGGETTLTLF